MIPLRRSVLPGILVALLLAGPADAAEEGSIVGTVVNKEGKPVPGMLVRAQKLEGPGFHGTALTGTDGRFAIRLRNLGSKTRYRVFPVPQGASRPESIEIKVSGGRTRDVKTFTLP